MKMKNLEDFIYPTQKKLLSLLCKEYENIPTVIGEKFMLVSGEAPILLVAHLDTVHHDSVKHICETENGNILMSPQGIGGDDRCGVYALHKIFSLSETKPWLLFTCDEEIGGIGAEDFCSAYAKDKLPKDLDNLKMIIEIDRKGSNDAVYYDCFNESFEAYITGKGFTTEWGSFSDISYIAPELGVAAVNLSSGYYNTHTLHEYIVRSELEDVIQRVCEIVQESISPDIPRFDYEDSDYTYYYMDEFAKNYVIEECYKKRKEPNVFDKMYDALLDYYAEDELEDLREVYGDSVIPALYESEFNAIK